jgi:hypothetical protein
VRPSGPDIRLHVGPLPIRVIRAVWIVLRRIFGVPAVPEPSCVPAPRSRARLVHAIGRPGGPRCLHCKIPMAEKDRALPEPNGVWAVFACRAVACSICQGICRNEARMFLPSHWQSGRPGEITRL